MKLGLSVDEILDIAEKGWGLNGKHEFEKGHSVQLSSFSSQFNRIRLATGKLESNKPEPVKGEW